MTAKTNHHWAIRELEWKIAENLRTARRCEAYRDPQEEIDVWYSMNKELQATVDFLKEQHK